jgi:hypothetical protein
MDENGRRPNLNSKMILDAMQVDRDTKTFILEIPEKYREIMSLYDRTSKLILLRTEASLKVAKFLADVLCRGFITPSYGFLSGAAWVPPERNIAADIASGIRVNAPEKTYAPVTAPDVSSWCMKVWGETADLPLLEQLGTLCELTGVMQKIGYKRKEAFFLFQTVKVLERLGIPNSGPALLQCMEEVCRLLGVGSEQGRYYFINYSRRGD